MVHHKVHNQLHAAAMQTIDQCLYVFYGPVSGIDIVVVGNIIPHVYLRRFVYYAL